MKRWWCVVAIILFCGLAIARDGSAQTTEREVAGYFTTEDTEDTEREMGEDTKVVARLRETRQITTQPLQNLGGLLARYDEQANSILPILAPMPDVMQVVDLGQVVIDDRNFQNERFLQRLENHGVTNRFGVMTYPVLISLKGRRHDYLIKAGDNEKSLARIKRHGRYSRFWFTKKHFKELGIKPPRSEFIAYHRIFNPARIVGYAVLVTPEGAREIAAAEKNYRTTESTENTEAVAMPMARAYAPMGNSALRFTAADRLGNGLVNFALAYPADMQGVPLDVVGCSSISSWNWQRLLSTNAPLSGFSFVLDTRQSPCRLLSCYRTDLPAGDSDGDGVTDGEEIFFDGTDKANPNDPPNIMGNISYATYSGGQTGMIYVTAETTAGSWSTNICDTITSTGAYHIVRVPHGSYFIKAWRDTDGDGTVGTYEATGTYSTAAISVTGQVSGINFSLHDPDTDGDLMGDWWELAEFGNLLHGGDGSYDYDADGVSDYDEFIFGSNPNNRDADRDGLDDDMEQFISQYMSPINPNSYNTDGDSLSDRDEYFLSFSNTDPGVYDATQSTAQILIQAANTSAEHQVFIVDCEGRDEYQVIAESHHFVIPTNAVIVHLKIEVFSREYPDYTEDQSEYNDQVGFVASKPGLSDWLEFDANVNTLHSSFTNDDVLGGVYVCNDLWIKSSNLTDIDGNKYIDVYAYAKNVGDYKLGSGVRVTVDSRDNYLDLDGDFNHDGNVDENDPDDPDETKPPGMIVPLNSDDDNHDGHQDRWETNSVNYIDNDLVKIHIDIHPDLFNFYPGLPDAGFLYLYADRTGTSGDIRIWSSPNKGTNNLVVDTATGLEGWWDIEPGGTNFSDVVGDYYVEGTSACQDGQIKVVLYFDGYFTAGDDEIILTVTEPELDIRETTRPANRIALNDPRDVKGVTNNILIWSTDALNNTVSFDLVKYPDTGPVYYKITQQHSWWNSGWPLEGKLTNDVKTIIAKHDPDDTDCDFQVWYGDSPVNREANGPYNIYVVSHHDYEDAILHNRIIVNNILKDWAQTVYARFLYGTWTGTPAKWHPTATNSVTYYAEQPPENIPYADLTQKFGPTSMSPQPPVEINGRRYPHTLVTVPVYYWEYNEITGQTNVSSLFLEDGRVKRVIKAFIQQIPYHELSNLYNLSTVGTGSVRVVQWDFSMQPHHKLYWTSDESISLTGGNDTLLDALGDSLALGDLWIVGSNPAKMLYGGSGYIRLEVEKLPTGDFKVHEKPLINMTVEDLFDFNYWNNNKWYNNINPIIGNPSKDAASIQCAHGHKGAGIGDVALLRFEVHGKVDDTGEITISK